MRLPNARHAFALIAATSALLMTAACGANDNDTDDTRASTATPATPASTAPAGGGASTDPAEDTEFTAGEYEAEGSYHTPGGIQSVEVELTLTADGTITELDVDGQAESGTSTIYQGKFESGINAQVVGKKITELSVSEVSGSSLTSKGFNAAIDDIIGQAQAQ